MHYLITSSFSPFYYIIYVDILTLSIYFTHALSLLCACAYCAVALFSRFGYKFNKQLFTYLLTYIYKMICVCVCLIHICLHSIILYQIWNDISRNWQVFKNGFDHAAPSL